MVKATPSYKAFIVDILVDSFCDNATVNYIIKQDKKNVCANKRINAIFL